MASTPAQLPSNVCKTCGDVYLSAKLRQKHEREAHWEVLHFRLPKRRKVYEIARSTEDGLFRCPAPGCLFAGQLDPYRIQAHFPRCSRLESVRPRFLPDVRIVKGSLLPHGSLRQPGTRAAAEAKAAEGLEGSTASHNDGDQLEDADETGSDGGGMGDIPPPAGSTRSATAVQHAPSSSESSAVPPLLAASASSVNKRAGSSPTAAKDKDLEEETVWLDCTECDKSLELARQYNHHRRLRHWAFAHLEYDKQVYKIDRVDGLFDCPHRKCPGFADPYALKRHLNLRNRFKRILRQGRLSWETVEGRFQKDGKLMQPCSGGRRQNVRKYAEMCEAKRRAAVASAAVAGVESAAEDELEEVEDDGSDDEMQISYTAVPQREPANFMFDTGSDFSDVGDGSSDDEQALATLRERATASRDQSASSAASAAAAMSPAAPSYSIPSLTAPRPTRAIVKHPTSSSSPPLDISQADPGSSALAFVSSRGTGPEAGCSNASASWKTHLLSTLPAAAKRAPPSPKPRLKPHLSLETIDSVEEFDDSASEREPNRQSRSLRRSKGKQREVAPQATSSKKRRASAAGFPREKPSKRRQVEEKQPSCPCDDGMDVLWDRVDKSQPQVHIADCVVARSPSATGPQPMRQSSQPSYVPPSLHVDAAAPNSPCSYLSATSGIWVPEPLEMRADSGNEERVAGGRLRTDAGGSTVPRDSLPAASSPSYTGWSSAAPHQQPYHYAFPPSNHTSYPAAPQLPPFAPYTYQPYSVGPGYPSVTMPYFPPPHAQQVPTFAVQASAPPRVAPLDQPAPPPVGWFAKLCS